MSDWGLIPLGHAQVEITPVMNVDDLPERTCEGKPTPLSRGVESSSLALEGT